MSCGMHHKTTDPQTAPFTCISTLFSLRVTVGQPVKILLFARHSLEFITIGDELLFGQSCYLPVWLKPFEISHYWNANLAIISVADSRRDTRELFNYRWKLSKTKKLCYLRIVVYTPKICTFICTGQNWVDSNGGNLLPPGNTHTYA